MKLHFLRLWRSFGIGMEDVHVFMVILRMFPLEWVHMDHAAWRSAERHYEKRGKNQRKKGEGLRTQT
ncbi:MAG: hypothetical protein Ct9H300mP28_29480 [Pseudomonadota bacterium]|nr:MAG: hypothetical protein Ct9H300mP28_29480 [Pseudomonadota bacterium]